MSAETRALRAKVAGLTARGVSPDRIQAARDELRWTHIIDAVKSWPPLTARQRAELAALLTDSRSDDAG